MFLLYLLNWIHLFSETQVEETIIITDQHFTRHDDEAILLTGYMWRITVNA